MIEDQPAPDGEEETKQPASPANEDNSDGIDEGFLKVTASLTNMAGAEN